METTHNQWFGHRMGLLGTLLLGAWLAAGSMAAMAQAGNPPPSPAMQSPDAVGRMSAGADVTATPMERTSPYVGAIVVDVETGKVIQEDHSLRCGYPASLVKLMTLFLALDAVSAGETALDAPVRTTPLAAATGGAQVWLKEGEVVPLSELLFAMAVNSANDAAVSVAEHVSGSVSAFVALMNQKAKSLGLSRETRFVSPTGLPVPDGQSDTASAADIAKLGAALLNEHPEALEYTSVKSRTFRAHSKTPLEMVNQNPLIGTVPGCDGLNTGYFQRAGHSIAATALRNGHRVVAVVLGADSRDARNADIKDWLEYGLSHVQEGADGGDFRGIQDTTPEELVANWVADWNAAPAEISVITGLMEDGLEVARAAKSLGKWETVADAASAYLHLHPNHAEAIALKQEAAARQSP